MLEKPGRSGLFASGIGVVPAGVPPCWGAPPVPPLDGGCCGLPPAPGCGDCCLPPPLRPCWTPLVTLWTPWLIALAAGAPTTGTGETTVFTTFTVTLQTVPSSPFTVVLSTVVAWVTMPRSMRGRPSNEPWMWSPGAASTLLPQGTVFVSADAVPGRPSRAEPASTNAVAPTAVALRARSRMLAAPGLVASSQDNDVKAAE